MAIHPTAVVASTARLGADVSVGAFAVIEDDTRIGDRCEIRAHAVVKRFTELGPDNAVHEHAVLGGEPQDVAFAGGASRLVIGARNRIREGVTLHRSSRPGGATVVGSDTFLMAYAHVAHDCRIGDHAILANNVALAGYVEIGEAAFVSGGVVVHQFCRIGRLAMLGGNSKLVQDALPFVISDGDPARARGVNVVGMRRAGLAAGELRSVKQAFGLLCRAGLTLEAALGELAALGSPWADEMAAFVRGSKRGFAHAGAGSSAREGRQA